MDTPSPADSLLASYAELGGTNYAGALNLPSKRAIPAICETLLQLLFPGFLEEEPLAATELPMITSERLATVREALTAEITRSLRCHEKSDDADCPDRAAKTVDKFLGTLPEVRRLLATDITAAYDGDPAAKSTEEIILSYPCVEAIAIQRLAHQLYKEDIPLLPRMMTEWAHERTCIDIHPGAEIGDHFFVDHGTGVVIGETCHIGSHVKLYQGVTLGARSFPKDENGRVKKGLKRHPTVEDNVTVYANATVLGGETVIGAGSTIGASVFLMESVPAGSVATLPDGGYSIKSSG